MPLGMEVCTSYPDHPFKKKITVRNQGNHFGTLSCFPMPCIDLSLWPELQEGHRVLEFLVRPNGRCCPRNGSVHGAQLPGYHLRSYFPVTNPTVQFKIMKKRNTSGHLFFFSLKIHSNLDQTGGEKSLKNLELFAISHQLGAGGKLAFQRSPNSRKWLEKLPTLGATLLRLGQCSILDPEGFILVKHIVKLCRLSQISLVRFLRSSQFIPVTSSCRKKSIAKGLQQTQHRTGTAPGARALSDLGRTMAGLEALSPF